MSKRVSKQEIIDKLVENNVKLLSAVTNLTVKIDELVEIFKKAAHHIEKGEIREPLARKLTDLLEQNKRIAKGLLLLENFVREREGYSPRSEKKEFEDVF